MIPRLVVGVDHHRAPRPGEVDGVEYRFVDAGGVRSAARRGGLLEWFEVYGHSRARRGSRSTSTWRAGRDVLLEIDVQGAMAVREQNPDALLVFVRPPSREEQRRGSSPAGTTIPAEIDRRLAAAEAEEARADRFDAVVVNDDVDTAVGRWLVS